MAVRIRLKRMGRKNRPFYRICVFDGRTRRDGRSIEDLGYYDTQSDKTETITKVNVDRARHWLGHGAKPSLTVHQVFKRAGVYSEVPAEVTTGVSEEVGS